MYFVDTSFYIALLNAEDAHHQAALRQLEKMTTSTCITTQAVIGELATVGSMRYSKPNTIAFINKLLSLENTTVVLEQKNDVELAWKLFQTTPSKNISWVDCYSLAVALRYKVKDFFTFDVQLAGLWKRER